MKKKLILLISILLLLVSCDSNHLITIDSEKFLDLSLENCIPKEIESNWQIEVIEMESSFSNELDYSISSNCYNEGKLYYVINGYAEMSNDCVEIYVMCKDVNSEEVNIVYSNKNISTMQISVIKYLQNNLFWIEEDQGKWRLIKYNLNTNNVEVVDSSEITPGSYPPNIEVNTESVYWYIIRDNYEINLMRYDVSKNVKSEHSGTGFYLETPYDVVNSQDNSLIYMKKNEDIIEIIIENSINNNKTTLITNSNKIVKVIGNEKYIIWIDDWYNTNLYLYELNKNKVTKLNCKGSNIRSMALFDDLLLVDFSEITFEMSDKKLSDISAVFQFTLDEKQMIPVYIPNNLYSTAWLSEGKGIFSINQWGVENSNSHFEKVILKLDIE